MPHGIRRPPRLKALSERSEALGHPVALSGTGGELISAQ